MAGHGDSRERRVVGKPGLRAPGLVAEQGRHTVPPTASRLACSRREGAAEACPLPSSQTPGAVQFRTHREGQLRGEKRERAGGEEEGTGSKRGRHGTKG